MRRGGGGSLRWIRGRVRSEVEIVRAEDIPARGGKSPEMGIYRGDMREMRWEYDGLEMGFGGHTDGCYEGGRESHPHRSLCQHQTWRYRDEEDTKRLTIPTNECESLAGDIWGQDRSLPLQRTLCWSFCVYDSYVYN
jgi:hypothetical protein